MTDLVRAVAAQTRPPEFASLVRRAGRRRMRQRAVAIGAVALAVVVGAVGAASLRGSDNASPLPAHPSPTMNVTVPIGSPAATAHSGLLVDTDTIVRTGTLVGFATDGRGGLLTAWQRCELADGCQSVIRTSGTSRQHGDFAATAAEGFTSASPGFVIGDGKSASVWSDSGSLRVAILKQSATSRIGPGTVLLPSDRALFAVDPERLLMWPLASSGCVAGQVGWASGTLAANGTIWAFPVVGNEGGHVPLCSSGDGVHWRLAIANVNPDPAAAPGKVVAVGRHVAALSAGDDGMPADPYWVSSDGGASFAKVSHLPFDRVDSIAATSDGTLYVADMAGEVYRSLDWETFAKVTAPKLWSLQPDGTSVAGQGGDIDHPAIYTVSSGGDVAPWPTPLR